MIDKPSGVIVFVKNKLISLDTIIPVLLELKESYNISSTIIVFDRLAHEGIKSNVVIRDVVKYIGSELYISRGVNNRIIRKVVIFSSLFMLMIKAVFGYKIIHFGILDIFPFKYIFSSFKRNVYFSQHDSFLHTHDKYDYLFSKSSKKDTPNLIGDNIIVFNDGMEGLDQISKDKNIYFFGETRTRKIWIDYAKRNENYYFSKYHGGLDYSKGFVVFILSTFGELKSIKNYKSGMLDLFHNTIEVLSSFDVQILLKPHVFTDMDIVSDAIKNKKNMHITYIHPTMLSLNSKLFISNTYSTTLADAYSLDVPTIEYSDYSDVLLQASNQKSMGYQYVSYFINNDKKLLIETIKNILSKPENKGFNGVTGDNSGLLEDLSK